MALTEQKVIGRISIREDEQMEIREDTIVMRDGVEIARTSHGRVIEPGSDTSALPARIKRITDAVWTPQIVQEYRDRRAEREAREPRP